MRADYCPIANEPCQSLCETPCDRKGLREAREEIKRLQAEHARMAERAGLFWNGERYIHRPPNTGAKAPPADTGG